MNSPCNRESDCAQRTFLLRGNVSDAAGAPLPNVAIHCAVDGRRFVLFTDMAGDYQFAAPRGARASFAAVAAAGVVVTPPEYAIARVMENEVNLDFVFEQVEEKDFTVSGTISGPGDDAGVAGIHTVNGARFTDATGATGHR